MVQDLSTSVLSQKPLNFFPSAVTKIENFSPGNLPTDGILRTMDNDSSLDDRSSDLGSLRSQSSSNLNFITSDTNETSPVIGIQKFNKEERVPTDALTGKEPFTSLVSKALDLAVNYSFESVHGDGHWCGELRSNATITAEYVFLKQSLGLEMRIDGDALCKWFLSNQNTNGSWGIAPNYPGDVSTTVEAYLALKILGIPSEIPSMRRACAFIVSVRGVSKVRIFTRIFLATFGLFPWSAVPELTSELIFMPSWAPINIYSFSSWARSTIIPLLIISHHRPIFKLPNGKSASNNFLDELWCDPVEKAVPYAKPLWDLWRTDIVALTFTAMDKILHQLGGLRSFPLRGYARRRCVNWILEHQEASGDWAGIFPPMYLGLLALKLEGYDLSDSPIHRGLEAVERFAWQDKAGKRVQACVSPVWDTVFTIVALCDAGTPTTDERLSRAVDWVKARQLLGHEGDWRIYRPKLSPGGFSFEYFNSWYPDVDDTAVAIIAFIKQDPMSASSPSVIMAVEWVLGMQNRDGGWAAFDVDNNKLFLNKIPCSDMDSLLDPSTADVTGRILEAFGLLRNNLCKVKVAQALLERVNMACHRALIYLASIQEPNGAWYGRWGSNYLYGTSNVLCGLAYFSKERANTQALVEPAIQWLKSVQNTDGGFGESLHTYKDPTLAGRGQSTASQTAWGMMALLAYLPPTDEAVSMSVAYLLKSQTKKDGSGFSWPETQYTATGFPRYFYLQYDLYRHYFPMMALGRYLQACKLKS